MRTSKLIVERKHGQHYTRTPRRADALRRPRGFADTDTDADADAELTAVAVTEKGSDPFSRLWLADLLDL